MIQMLVEKGSMLEHGNWSAVEYALIFNQPHIVELLLKNGADATFVNSSSHNTLINTALHYKMYKSIELLMQYGADINLRNHAGDLPLVNAAIDKKVRIPEACTEVGERVFNLLVERTDLALLRSDEFEDELERALFKADCKLSVRMYVIYLQLRALKSPCKFSKIPLSNLKHSLNHYLI